MTTLTLTNLCTIISQQQQQQQLQLQKGTATVGTGEQHEMKSVDASHNTGTKTANTDSRSIHRVHSKNVIAVTDDDSKTILIPIKSCLSSKDLVGDCTSFQQLEGYGLKGDKKNETTKTKKSVSFDKIEIREHERTISDNPSISTGIGLGIGWGSIDTLQCTVSEFELYRPPRRHKSDLLIPPDVREHILLNECDITQNEINQSLKQISKIKVSRFNASKDHKEYIDCKNKNDSTTATVTNGAQSLPRRRSFMGLATFIRNKINSVDVEAQRLMDLSIRAEKRRQEHVLAHISNVQQQQQLQDAIQDDMNNSDPIVEFNTNGSVTDKNCNDNVATLQNNSLNYGRDDVVSHDDDDEEEVLEF